MAAMDEIAKKKMVLFLRHITVHLLPIDIHPIATLNQY